MLNRRTFLGAAVAATILPAGDALAAKPGSGHAPSGRTIEAHETPEGVLYTIRDGKRRTEVLARVGPNDNFGEGPSEPLPPAFIVVSYMLAAPAERDASTRRVLPAMSDGRIVNSFSRPPSLEDVVAFHDACCADVPRRVIDARDGKCGSVLYSVKDPERETTAHGELADIDILRLFSTRPGRTPIVTFRKATSMCSLSEVLAFHERCCAEDGAAAPRG